MSDHVPSRVAQIRARSKRERGPNYEDTPEQVEESDATTAFFMQWQAEVLNRDD